MDNHERDKQGRKVWDQVASYIALGAEQERKWIMGIVRECVGDYVYERIEGRIKKGE